MDGKLHIAASSYDFSWPTRGMAKNPWGILSQFGECEGEQGKRGNFIATGIWKYFACN